MWIPRGARPLIVAALGAGLFLVPTASAKVARPKAPGALQPASSIKVDRMPVFTWSPVKHADHYEFQMSADKGFNSTVAGSAGKQATKNTAVTIPTALINGTYWWRLRTVTAKNDTSAWTKGRAVVLNWAPVMNVTGPADATAFATPAATATTAPVMRWAAMPGAAQYAVAVASDPLMSTLVSPGATAEVTDGTSYTLNGTLPDGTYYWTVTPLDSQGHKGLPSVIHSFSTAWQASAGLPVMTDIATDPELMDPVFTWTTVLGASAYQVEISTSQDFAPGSKICCDGTTTGVSYSPTSLLQDNTYYWRVRPYDGQGNAGPWTNGLPFTKTFDNVPPLIAPAVKNLKMRNMSDIGSDEDITPVVMWDSVMGASGYQVEIDPWNDTYLFCDQSLAFGRYITAVPAWAPLGAANGAPPQIGNATNPTSDGNGLLDGQAYCVQVRAFDTDSSGTRVYGDWTAMYDAEDYAFRYDKDPWPVNPGDPDVLTDYDEPCGGPTYFYMCANTYNTPVNTNETQTPTVFTWTRVDQANGYYVIVSKDPNFANILDYAFVNDTAYTPRNGGNATAYADETAGSSLYWAVMPTFNSNGTNWFGIPAQLASQGNKRLFNKQSTPPALQPATVDGAGVSFRWAPVLGAAFYSLQVSTDSTFSNVLEDVRTDSASYTATTSYPAGQTLYYRVRANDIAGNGLAWATGVFNRALPAPVPTAASGDINAAKLDGIPTWAWSPVPGAVAYDVHVDKPSGATQDINGVRTSTMSWVKLDGPGVWKWKVRAEFSKGLSGSLPGPWSDLQTFTRTFGEPQGRRVVATKTRLIFSWEPKQGAKTYHLQVASDSAFAQSVEDVTQDGVRYAPSLNANGYADGGTLYWHVAAIDAEGNQGDWTSTSKVLLAKGLKLAGDAGPTKGKASSITVTVTTAKGAPVKAVTVRVAGAGTQPRARKTNKKGKVVLKVRPTSAGTVTFRATKSGYQLGTLVYTIT
jgi:large repetitive protein